MYAKRKKASIERARTFISNGNEDWVKFFDEHKKKDDLADTVMQALSFIEKRPSEGNSSGGKEKKVSPRKPTENQKNTKYSKANLAWLVKTGAKQDARFRKDLARYYSSIDELKIEFKL
jgi:hypothetical protein